MAVLTTQAVGNREELSDVVSRITPEDTPIYSLIEKGKCTTYHPEWETDELAAPGANIRKAEVGSSDRASYDVIYAHRQDNLAKPLTAMTLGEVIDAQKTWSKAHGSSAAGG